MKLPPARNFIAEHLRTKADLSMFRLMVAHMTIEQRLDFIAELLNR